MDDEPYQPASDSEPPKRPGLLDSARRMLATFIALIHTRLELFTTEIEEEIQRAAGILLWGLVALFFGSLTVLMIAMTILIVFWDDNRVLAASLITATFLVLTGVFGFLARARLRAKPRFMASSVEELKRDREALERGT
jgi:uncharacterized membrane protein YqjE